MLCPGDCIIIPLHPFPCLCAPAMVSLLKPNAVIIYVKYVLHLPWISCVVVQFPAAGSVSYLVPPRAHPTYYPPKEYGQPVMSISCGWPQARTEETNMAGVVAWTSASSSPVATVSPYRVYTGARILSWMDKGNSQGTGERRYEMKLTIT